VAQAVLLALVVCPLGAIPLRADADGAGPCIFALGFKTFHDALPDVVGDRCPNEYGGRDPNGNPAYQPDAEHDDGQGNRIQHTVKGLLVWRKADNWTAFTDGYWTWVAGPLGIQKRQNTERFSWEQLGGPGQVSNPASSPIAAADTACQKIGWGAAALQAIIPDVVGQCSGNFVEQSGGGPGTTVTTKGLLSYHDGGWEFTDGYQTYTLPNLASVRATQDQMALSSG